ncbi:MAG: T9SS type A sorting domain-containing protein, partial [Sphingobacteriales bacterium]|nr:T9SS type A sorting domain-containing protein [Sphingobacteriales bacterium]
GNTATCTQTVTVIDIVSISVTLTQGPAITCNGGNTTLTVSATGGTGSYKYKLDAGSNIPASSYTSAPYTFPGVTAGLHTVTVTDNAGNTKTATITISQPAAITPNCNNNNPVLYFGYTADQSATITVTPTGGTAPYTVSFTMNRPIACNVTNSAGDEVWTAVTGGSTTNATCPSSGSLTLAPVSTKSGIAAGGSYGVNIILLSNATITATVTDACRNTSTCTSQVIAEDVRCYPGNNSNNINNTKVTICHKTGNTCTTLCVSPDAVAAHLAHGDFLGQCQPNSCTNPNAGNNGNGKIAATSSTGNFSIALFEAKAYPNPTTNTFNLQVISSGKEVIDVVITDILGRQVQQLRIRPYQTVELGRAMKKGIYMVHILQGDRHETLKLQKL